ncbi:MAG: DUF29 domain-containing protein [Acetobacteraceae bacterium]|nr:DUF29 domain-containing protein [Acetobacteraceae bacterium]
MDQTPRYEEDIFAWSQHQARVLRGLAARGVDLPHELDLEHVAEEIEGLGISELNSVLIHLEGMLIQLAMAASSPADASPRRGWLVEVNEHRRQALRRYTNAMRQRIDLDGLWRGALREAAADLRLYGEALAPLPTACPYDLADLLSPEPNAEALLARLVPPPSG